MMSFGTMGSKIDICIPQPERWADTVEYIYVKDSRLLSDSVKENIRYLGGKV
jgi:hypothetical protein